jgi:hypothetical protein
MATVTRLQIAKMLTKTISGVFADNLRENTPEYTQLFDADSMDRAVVEETEVVGTGYAGVIPEGRPVNYDSYGEGYTARYRAIKFGIGTQVTKEAVRDNLWIKAGPKAGVFLETSLRQTKEFVHALTFNDTTILGGDGVALLSTLHPTLKGGFQSNTLAVPSQISESALEDLLIQIRLTKDSAGLFRAIKPVKLTAHPGQEYNILRILRGVERTGTTDRDINAMKMKGVFQNDPVLLTWLTNTQYWGIKTDCPDGLKTMQRDAVELTMSPDFDTGSVKSKAEERYAVGWTNWRGFFGSSP